ncbi:MAG: acetyl-CoA carboxylase, biotin carboxyl carrier protein, partial [Sphingobacteriales bacterium]|nr:acetyl-CoA carboxylase, biotin carboxyl carrier protein [Sphingobacteriales bacterium]
MDFKEIQELVKLLSKSDIAELKLESENFKITLRTKAYVEAQNGGDRVVYSTAPAPAMIAASPVAAPSAAAEAPKAADTATPPPAADTNL